MRGGRGERKREKEREAGKEEGERKIVEEGPEVARLGG